VSRLGVLVASLWLGHCRCSPWLGNHHHPRPDLAVAKPSPLSAIRIVVTSSSRPSVARAQCREQLEVGARWRRGAWGWRWPWRARDPHHVAQQTRAHRMRPVIHTHRGRSSPSSVSSLSRCGGAGTEHPPSDADGGGASNVAQPSEVYQGGR
jgi:hypothetical protein